MSTSHNSLQSYDSVVKVEPKVGTVADFYAIEIKSSEVTCRAGSLKILVQFS